jgi:hypothetical protein
LPKFSIAGTETDHCNLSSPSYIEWDAMTSFLESVMSRVSQSPEPQPDVQEGVQWLGAVLYYETKVSTHDHLMAMHVPFKWAMGSLDIQR